MRKPVSGVDLSDLVLEIPIATECRGAGDIVGCRHVGAGQRRQVADKGPPSLVFGDIAAVDQDIGFTGQRIAPVGDLAAARLQRGGIQRGRTEAEAGIAAVR